MLLHSWLLLALLPLAPAARGDWSLDFNSGSTSPLMELDPKQIFAGANEFTASVVNGALRMQFHGVTVPGFDNGNDSGVMFYPAPFGSFSARVLIRFSTLPAGGRINAGFASHLNPDPQNFRAYVCVLGENGHLQLQKITPDLNAADLCTVRLPGFPVGQDVWVRYECQSGSAGLTLRARSWPNNGTVEPCAWDVECIEASPYPAGYVGLLANEDRDGQDYLDMDDASVSTTMSCIEICDNGLDDDQNLLTDCYDPVCWEKEPCACPVPFADADRDHDVDMLDFAVFQLCYTGAGDPDHAFNLLKCRCFDRNHDNAIDETDGQAFVICGSGPGITADPNCGAP
jgi:hypothetical protein